jgi:hypothetical protein|tara:strand:+ start:668 stop:994 length:327 start_codon:yes stop_codon:yes gene_type:complete
MTTAGHSRANENKRIRQEALREQLSNGKHVEHVIEMVDKISRLEDELDAGQVNRLKIASDLKMRLINKYLPDLKQSEVELQGGITAVDKTRAELEARLRAAGLDPESY